MDGIQLWLRSDNDLRSPEAQHQDRAQLLQTGRGDFRFNEGKPLRRLVCVSLSRHITVTPLFSKVKVFTLKPDGALDLSHSSGWRHFELGKDNDKTIIQIQPGLEIIASLTRRS